jgi:hypothetical protein
MKQIKKHETRNIQHMQWSGLQSIISFDTVLASKMDYDSKDFNCVKWDFLYKNPIYELTMQEKFLLWELCSWEDLKFFLWAFAGISKSNFLHGISMYLGNNVMQLYL